VLHLRGYATAGFVANTEYAAWDSGLNRGFEHYEDYPGTPGVAMEATAFGRVVYPWFRQALPWPLAERLLPRLDRHPSAEKIADSFIGWLDRARPAPFFAFLNFMEAHDFNGRDFGHLFRSRRLRPVSRWAWSLTPPVRLTPTDVRRKQDAYDNAIAYLDSELGRLFRELERRQLLNNTLVIVTADHGEEFAEHGLVNHGHSLYRYSLHVPLVFWVPGRVAEGRRVAAPVSLRNLAATVLELVDPGRPALLPGRSLARFWTGADTAPDTIVASVGRSWNLPCWYPVSRGAIRSIAFDAWRYIRNEGDGAEELYDFENDLLERWNLADSDSGGRVLRRHRAALASLSKPARSAADCRD
jgi:arylsulfatase A-like enzyme